MRNKLPHYIMIICIIFKYKYTKVDKFFVILVISLVPFLYFLYFSPSFSFISFTIIQITENNLYRSYKIIRIFNNFILIFLLLLLSKFSIQNYISNFVQYITILQLEINLQKIIKYFYKTCN